MIKKIMIVCMVFVVLFSSIVFADSELPITFTKKYVDGSGSSLTLNSFKFSRINYFTKERSEVFCEFSSSGPDSFYVKMYFYDVNGNLIDNSSINIGSDPKYQYEHEYIPSNTKKISFEIERKSGSNDIYTVRKGNYIYEAKDVEMYDKNMNIKKVSEFLAPVYEKDGWNYCSKMVTLYSVDGRTTIVNKKEVEKYNSVGWYNTPVVKMYAPDGREIIINKSEKEAYKAVGWYTYPVVTMYAQDGRTAVINKNDTEAWKAVGWYTSLKVKMYAPDGRTTEVLKNDVEAWKRVGWYTYPVITMYAPDGRTIIINKDAKESYKAVGWYTSPVTKMYSHDGRTIFVGKNEVEAYKKVGWYTSKTLASYSYYPDIDAPTYDSVTGENFIKTDSSLSDSSNSFWLYSKNYVYTCQDFSNMSKYTQVLEKDFEWNLDSMDTTYEYVVKNNKVQRQAKNSYKVLKKGNKSLTVFYGFATGTMQVWQTTYLNH